jgi:hypothetical protein
MSRRRHAGLGILLAVATAAACEMESAMKRPEAEPPRADPADIESIDAIVGALYESISFVPGGEPDWDRLRSLFHLGGRLIPRAGEGDVVALSVEEFIELSREFIETSGFKARGFHEREIARRKDAFGEIAHAFSTYESRHTAADPEPFSRGINSIQLVRHAGRWWVLSVLWDVERPDNPLPPPEEADAG